MMGIRSAQHAEYRVEGEQIVTPLACSLMDTDVRIRFEIGSRTLEAYRANTSVERMTCNYGINPDFQQAIHDAGLRVAATDTTGEARVVELSDHPFYVATLFQPQLSSTEATPHPLLLEFMRVAAGESA